MKSIVYVADIDQDIDDIIAVEYLNDQGFLKYVVLDSEPQSAIARERVQLLQNKGIHIEPSIQDGEDILFVGGSLKKVREFLQAKNENNIKLLVMNGGFVGSNIVSEDKALKKFKGKQFARTYNFNLDVRSTEFVLASRMVEKIYLIGKNVCHSDKNTKMGIWKDIEFLQTYELSNNKRLHDLLMVDEGLKLLHGNQEECNLLYANIHVIKRCDDEEKRTKWGSELAGESKIIAAIDWRM